MPLHTTKMDAQLEEAKKKDPCSHQGQPLENMDVFAEPTGKYLRRGCDEESKNLSSDFCCVQSSHATTPVC